MICAEHRALTDPSPRVGLIISGRRANVVWDSFGTQEDTGVTASVDGLDTDTALGSEWVKIIPNTDTALFLAMAYHVYTTGKYDKAYLGKYTVGFDKFLPYLDRKSVV